MIIELNTLSPEPLYEQLRNQIVLGIAAKKLIPNETLPSVRRLAADLGINFHTVNKAYAMLSEEGYIVMDRRKGAVIAPTIAGGGEFLAALSHRLLLNAAEAVCHGMSESEFVALCAGCYQNAIGNLKNGGTS